MIINYIRLLFGGSLGTAATILNIKATQAETANYMLQLADITAICGIISAGFTCVFLYWQIKKIRKELKQKKP